MSRDYQHVHRQGSEDGIAFNTGIIHGEPEHINASGTEAEWLKFNILSLDGGGIRGYWSLLTLEKLMEFIAQEEEKDVSTYHSFSPQSWPRDVSQAPLTEEERKRIDDADNEEERTRALSCTRRYLPCHYFDNICGSSTGALIAIMLGRLRMTVPDCIYEYRSLGQKVFGNPRFFTAINFGVGNRYKYKAARLEKVVKEVTKRRNEKPYDEVFGKITFPSGRGLCTTFVTTRKSQPKDLSNTHYLIRSYDHDKQIAPNRSTMPTPRTTVGSSRADTGMSADRNTRTRERENRRINYDKAQEFEIWQVARAATAAPFYFEPLKVEHARTSGHILFTDGGFSHANNPTQQGKQEIEDLYGLNSIGIVVSVGTARKKKEENGLPGLRFFNKIPREMRGWAHEMSDPEEVHYVMQREKGTQRFQYYRLNDPEGLDIEFDRWEPKQNLFSKDAGSKTITTITDAFSRWACKGTTIKQLQDCAELLVACRRKRMSTLKWERYATGARYRCRCQGCDIEDFFDGTTFRDHLRTHGIPEHHLDGDVDYYRYQWRYQASSVPHSH